MKNKILILSTLILGFLAGIIFSGIAISISSAEMFVKEYRSPYDFDKTVDIIAHRINSSEGWHVTEVIDQNEESLANGGKQIGHYKIIKYCSGNYSSQMLQDDERKKIGSMLPKTFAVYEKSDGRVFVSTLNGAVMGKIFGGETEKIIEKVSLEVEDMMRFLNMKYTLF